jgi:hypothetical protein
MISHKQRTLLLSIFLVAGILFQGWNLLGEASRDLGQVRRAIGQSGLWRSANFAQGQRFANYVRFLHENIPEGARVVLPPDQVGPKSLSTTPYMQFFLSPRQVINCTESACLENLSTENTYILAVRGFPGHRLASQTGEVRMFDDQWGVVLPLNPQSGNLYYFQGFENLLGLSGAIFTSLIWLFFLTACGAVIIGCLVPDWSVPYKVALGYGLGLGMLSLGIAVAALVGLSIDRMLVLAMMLFLLVTSLGAYFLTRRRDDPARPRSPAWQGFDLWLVVFIVIGGLAAIFSAGKGYHTVDAIQIWGVKGNGIAFTGSLASVTEWGTNTLPYPLNIPILIAAARLLFNEVLPASKLIFSGYFTAMLFVLYLSMVGLKINRNVAGLSTLLIASTPLLFRHAAIGYANLPLSYYLVTAMLVLVQAIHTNGEKHPTGMLFVSGLFFAAASWTRPEGFALACLGIAGVLGIAIIWPGTSAFSPRRWIPVLIPVGVYALFWQLIKSLAYPQGSARSGMVQAAFERIKDGDFHIEAIGYIGRRIIEDLFRPEIWGVLGLGLLLIGCLVLLGRGHLTRSAALMLGSGLLWVGLIAGIYYLASFDRVHDLSWWVNSGLDRMLLPAISLLWIGGVSLVQLLDYRKDGSTPVGSP